MAQTSKMNVGKVLAGGVLAGIVLCVFDYVSNSFLFVDDWQTLSQRHNFDAALMSGTTALITMCVIDLVLGLLIALVYASIRPRFGPGPGTGAIASFLVFLPAALIVASFGGWFIPWDLVVRQSTVMLVGALAAGFAAGWVYAEEGDPD
jgi:predicted ABC-type sugar transport system permease subunit